MAFLSQNEIPFEKHDVTEPGVAEEMVNISGKKQTPLIKIDNQIFTGYSANKEAIESLVLS